jgi:hypothetical protein
MLALVIACRGADVRAVLLVSMAGTITNAAVGFQYFLQRRRELGRPLRALVDTLLVGAAIAVLQVALYPTSGLFFDLFGMREERRYIGISLHSVLFRPFDFLFSGFVLPLPPYQGELTSEMLWRNSLVWPTARPEILRAVAVLSALLLLAGAYVVAAWRFATGDRVWIDRLVAGFLVFELALHTVYGDTPFLYSFHFVPFLILFLAFQLPRASAAVWMLLITVAVQASCDWDRFLQVFG